MDISSILSLSLSALLFLLFIYYLASKAGSRNKRKDLIQLEINQDKSEVDPPGSSDPKNVEVDLKIPEELIEACVQRRCVFFGGNALGVQAGYPPWPEALSTIIQQATFLNPEERRALESSLSAGKINVAAEFLTSRSRDYIVAEAKTLYGKSPTSLSSLIKDLQSIPFVGVLTTHWHDLLTVAFAHRRPNVIAARTPIPDLPSIAEPSLFWLVKLYGSIESNDLILTPIEYRRLLEDSQALSRFLTSIALTRTLLFLGASLETIDIFFSNLQIRSKPGRPHFALIPTESGIELQRERFLNKYGVHLLECNPVNGLDEISDFISRLRKKIVHWAERSPKHLASTTALTAVRLGNIGPFTELFIDLKPGWNVLLGNNGVGKSTILRAIALGLCGDHESVQSCAQRLLRAGKESGFIELSVGEDIYRTELVREPERVRAICYQLTPLQTGSWAVLAFPPLRGISMRSSRGPSSEDGLPRPAVADIQPILDGDLDRRLDSFKQWIVNLDARSEAGHGISQAEAVKNVQLVDSLFDLVKAFMPGMEIDFCEVNRRSWEVLVKTKDGIVPIEQISKGMSSLIGWLGTLLQRMYEIHAASEQPEHEPALVLIDEIDAHLHPEWQQLLVPALKEHFPRLQMIATTHSPLIVAGMKRDEVFIVFRSEDFIEVSPPPLDFEGMRADQILTSPLFGLATTRSHGARKDIDRYSELLGKTERNKDEEHEFSLLRKKLRTVLSVGETAVERSVEQAVNTVLTEMSPGALVSRADPKVQLEVKRQLAQVLGRGES